jgi:hypothetical protein
MEKWKLALDGFGFSQDDAASTEINKDFAETH